MLGLLLGREIQAKSPTPETEFSELVQLAPMVVKGESLSVSIFARSRSDRRYGEAFSKEVVEVVYEAVTPSTGRGLIIVGQKGEPHPIYIFRRFLALAQAGRLAPEIAARAPELDHALHRWESIMHEDDKNSGSDASMDMEYEKIVTALPLPLEGIAAKLYQLAWEEKFDASKVEDRLCALHAGDLERRDLFKRYDWAFYLPPKGAFEKALDSLISDALKEEEVGFFARMLVKGALIAVKPKLRRAIEGFRQGMLFMTIVEARTSLDEQAVSQLTEAYLHPFMPEDKEQDHGNDHEQLVRAVRKRLGELKQTAPAPQPSQPN